MNLLETYALKGKGRILAKGKSVGEKIGAGPINVISSAKDIAKFKKGEILVTQMTDPDWEPIMKIAAGIVTDRGGRTCHAAIISRELGIPCVVGTGNGSSVLGDYRSATVCCAEGETGLVYEGFLEFEIKRFDMQHLEKPQTKIMMNVGDPDNAFHLSFIPNDGVGLARLEFIINNSIRIHPMALVRFDQMEDDHDKKEIEQLTFGYDDKKVFFVDRLAQGVAKIAAAFYPKDVIVRMSDLKSNEYANLIGGSMFEPVEDNPMIGFRGASRYYDEDYQEGFGLECLAMKKVRDEMGLTNVKLMIPFCRTVEEGRLVIAEMRKYGLVQGQNGLEIYVMCEIPSNVIMADEFSEVFDGFSIGSNDLTQLVLGLDRDSEKISHVFDERDPAVKRMVEWVIASAKRNGRKIGICGQAPSDYPEFAEFLVRCGIDSISLNPDTVIKTTEKILQTERELGKSKRKESKRTKTPA
jgi:pyruvate,water dikinase